MSEVVLCGRVLLWGRRDVGKDRWDCRTSGEDQRTHGVCDEASPTLTDSLLTPAGQQYSCAAFFSHSLLMPAFPGMPLTVAAFSVRSTLWSQFYRCRIQF